MIFVEVKKAIVEVNLFDKKETLTINEQRTTTRVYFGLLSSMYPLKDKDE